MHRLPVLQPLDGSNGNFYSRRLQAIGLGFATDRLTSMDKNTNPGTSDYRGSDAGRRYNPARFPLSLVGLSVNEAGPNAIKGTLLVKNSR